jgi:hypothetical protein
MSKKLGIAIVILLVLVGLAVSLQTARQAEDTAAPKVEVKIPKVERDKVDELELSAPERDKVRLVKKGDGWRMVEPTDAAADQDAVNSALDKLADLEVTGVAATKAENHARLEVDEKKGTHVVAKGGGKVLIDAFIGNYQSGNSMLRLQGQNNVATVRGSIRYAFTKYPREWRDRVITKVEPKDVQRIAFDNKDGHIEFARKSADDWEQVAGKKEKKIDPLDVAKVRGIVGTASVLNAVDFAAPSVTPEQAGLGAGAATVTLKLASDAGEQQILYRIGNQVEQNYYAQRDGIDTIFQISTWVGGRLVPTHETFIKKKEAEKSGPLGSPTNPIPVEPKMAPPGMNPHAPH